MFELHCPQCGHQLRIAAKFAGQQGRCKYCKTVIQVPDAPDALDHTGEASASTALTDLQRDGSRAHSGTPQPAQVDEYRPLGCLFWLTAIILTPIAFIWALLLPKGHPRKPMAVLVTVALLVFLPVVFFGVVVGVPAALVLMADGSLPNTSQFDIQPDPLQIDLADAPLATVRVGGVSDNLWSITWHSSDSTIAEINGDGASAHVKGIAPGEATIRVVNNATDEQTTAQVVVNDSRSVGIPLAATDQPAAVTPMRQRTSPQVAGSTPGSSAEAIARTLPQVGNLQLSATNEVPEIAALEGADPAELNSFTGAIAMEHRQAYELYLERLDDHRDWDFYQRTYMQSPETFFYFEGRLETHFYYLYGEPDGSGTRVWLVLQARDAG